MPNAFRSQTQYVFTGDPDTVDDSAIYYPGQLGQVYETETKTYQYVKGDSGATAAGSQAGALTNKQIVFWKDRQNYLVTNDLRFSDRNNVAGVLTGSKTAAYYFFILQRGDAISVKSDGNGASGDIAIANSGAAADITRVAAGTAPTYLTVGKITAAAAGGNINVDVDLPSAP